MSGSAAERRVGREIGLARHRHPQLLGEQADDLLVVAVRHAGGRGAAVGHPQHLEQGRDVELLRRDVAEPGIAEVDHQIRRILAEALEQRAVIVLELEAEARHPLECRAHRAAASRNPPRCSAGRAWSDPAGADRRSARRPAGARSSPRLPARAPLAAAAQAGSASAPQPQPLDSVSGGRCKRPVVRAKAHARRSRSESLCSRTWPAISGVDPQVALRARPLGGHRDDGPEPGIEPRDAREAGLEPGARAAGGRRRHRPLSRRACTRPGRGPRAPWRRARRRPCRQASRRSVACGDSSRWSIRRPWLARKKRP